MKCLNLSTKQLSISSLFQVVSQFSNFLNFADGGGDEKRLVGLRLAAPQAKILPICLPLIPTSAPDEGGGTVVMGPR